jgi:hypothetical protein
MLCLDDGLSGLRAGDSRVCGVLIAMSGVGPKSLDVVKPSLEEGANKIGEAIENSVSNR